MHRPLFLTSVVMERNFVSSKVKALSIIAPDKRLLGKVKKALALIKKLSPGDYRAVFLRLRVIFITSHPGYTNEFFMPEKIWFANASVIEKNDLIWLASLIVHEAFHATQFKNGKYVLPLVQLEPPALRVQQRFLRKTGNINLVRGVESAKREKYWRKMRNDKRSSAYFRRLLRLWEENKLTLKKI